MRHSFSAWLATPVLAALALTSAPAMAVCSFGPVGSEPSLQAVFNNMFGTPNAPQTQAGCVADGADRYWETVDSVASATILVEIAGNSSGNTLGIYDGSSVGNTLEIFSGPTSAGSRAYVTISGAPGAYTVTIDRFTTAGNSSSSTVFGSSVFGFYLQQPSGAGNERFYSDSALNPAMNGDSALKDYMYAYRGNNAIFQSGSLYTPPMVQGTRFRYNDAILAWEDLSSGSDRDYQDMVVLVRDMTPVPLPAAAWLLGCGLFFLRGLVRLRPRLALSPAFS